MESLDCLAWARSLARKPAAHKGDRPGALAHLTTLRGATFVLKGQHTLGVQVHARAGDQLCAAGKGPIGLTPSELARQLRIVINQAAGQ